MLAGVGIVSVLAGRGRYCQYKQGWILSVLSGLGIVLSVLGGVGIVSILAGVGVY